MEWRVQKWPNKCHWWRSITAPVHTDYYQNIEVCVLILNRRVKIDEITNQLQISHRSIYEIIYHRLHFHTVYSRWFKTTGTAQG
jgi:hypothetical protein